MVINFELGAHYFNEKTFQIEKTVIVSDHSFKNLEFQNRIEPIFL